MRGRVCENSAQIAQAPLAFDSVGRKRRWALWPKFREWPARGDGHEQRKLGSLVCKATWWVIFEGGYIFRELSIVDVAANPLKNVQLTLKSGQHRLILFKYHSESVSGPQIFPQSLKLRSNSADISSNLFKYGQAAPCRSNPAKT